MTAQQEAILLIKSLPDDTLGILVELLKRMVAGDGYPVDMRTSDEARAQPRKRRLGIADGKYDIPDDIDFCNDEIAEMFGVAE